MEVRILVTSILLMVVMVQVAVQDWEVIPIWLVPQKIPLRVLLTVLPVLVMDRLRLTLMRQRGHLLPLLQSGVLAGQAAIMLAQGLLTPGDQRGIPGL